MTNTKANDITIEQVIAFLGLKDIAVPVSDKLSTPVPVVDIVTRNPSMIRFGLLAGFMGKLNNVSKGGLKAKLGREATDADLAAARSKIVTDAWLAGSWNLSGSGPRESIVGEMREAYLNKQVALGRTLKQAEASIRSTVTAAFGKDEKATFVRFLDAVATIKAKALPEGSDESYETIRDSLEASAMEAVEAARKEAAESMDALDIDIADLF